VNKEDSMGKMNFFLSTLPFRHRSSSYEVGIGCAWYSWEACGTYSSLVQKKKMKIEYFSSHKLPKLQSTSFWSQGILGINIEMEFFYK
jgi:hypothetical protein